MAPPKCYRCVLLCDFYDLGVASALAQTSRQSVCGEESLQYNNYRMQLSRIPIVDWKTVGKYERTIWRQKNILSTETLVVLSSKPEGTRADVLYVHILVIEAPHIANMCLSMVTL